MNSIAAACLLGAVLMLAGGLAAGAAQAEPAAKVLPGGVHQYQVESDLQKGAREIRVLVPDKYNPKNRYRVLYVLPVGTGFDSFGYALGILKEMDAHNRYDLIIVQMDFAIEPWYGDHATDQHERQASYLKDFVAPFVEKRYSTPGTPEGRLLFGFSKSGWGAVSMILKYPDFYGYAASWDAPLAAKTCAYNIKNVYGTQAQMDAFRPDLLVPAVADRFRQRKRLVITGESFWKGEHMEGFHRLLEKHGILHHYDDTQGFQHRWSKEWMDPTLKALVELTAPSARGR